MSLNIFIIPPNKLFVVGDGGGGVVQGGYTVYFVSLYVQPLHFDLCFLSC